MIEILSVMIVNLITGVILLYIEYRWFANTDDKDKK